MGRNKTTKAIGLQDVLGASRYQLQKMDKKELKEYYKVANRTLKNRIKTFDKHDAADAIPKSLRFQKASMNNKMSLISAISNSANFLMSEKGSYSKYKRHQSEVSKKIEKRMKAVNPDFEFGGDMSRENLGKFMGEMRKRVNNDVLWKNGASDSAEQLFAEADRLGLNPNQFLRNYSYWLNHVDELENAQPISKGKAKPSSYIKQLGLPSIKEWKKN